MTVNELYDIADRFEHLNTLAVEFGWTRNQLMSAIYQLAVDLREEGDTVAEAMASEHEYNQQFV